MPKAQITDCITPAPTMLQRVNFFNRQILTADDMTTDRAYLLQKLRRHNRFEHGWGLVCGLTVTAAPVAGTLWRVQIGSGYALGPYGDEIFVGEAVYFDLLDCVSGGTNLCEPNMPSGGAGTSTTAYLAIQHAECLARPVQVASAGCGCGEDTCQYSRILDSFKIRCLPQLPPQPPPPPILCQVVRGGSRMPCPPCPTDPWVVLAKIVLPSAFTMNITNSNIDNVSVRRVLLSTAVLQDQIVRCCCQGQSSSSPSSSTVSLVDLQSIMVRFVDPNDPNQPFTAAATVTTDTVSLSWEYQLALTGAAPAGGFAVSTASNNSTVTTRPTSVTVSAGATTFTTPAPMPAANYAAGATTITVTATAIPTGDLPIGNVDHQLSGGTMSTVQLTDCTSSKPTRLQRVHFFSRQLLTADDLITDRDYFLEKLRRHNRFLHGWGVVYGLAVAAAPTAAKPWQVRIGSGCALGPYGDEIFVGGAVYFDLAACLAGAETGGTAYVAIRYAECLAIPIQGAISSCGSDEDPCQYSRILDSFQIQCLSQLPPAPKPAPPTLCQIVVGRILAPCPPCPTSPWVVLAKIALPSSSTAEISDSSIDNISNRHIILSTAVLEDQIVRCCCGPVSSSSTSAIASRRVPGLRRGAVPAIPVPLILGQRATRVAGTQQVATQIAVTVMNNGSEAAENVALSVDLSPALSAEDYRLKPAAGWQSASLTQLKSLPTSLPARKAQTFSFEIEPVKQSAAVTITSVASATSSKPGISGTPTRLQAIVGG